MTVDELLIEVVRLRDEAADLAVTIADDEMHAVAMDSFRRYSHAETVITEIVGGVDES